MGLQMNQQLKWFSEQNNCMDFFFFVNMGILSYLYLADITNPSKTHFSSISLFFNSHLLTIFLLKG